MRTFSLKWLGILACLSSLCGIPLAAEQDAPSLNQADPLLLRLGFDTSIPELLRCAMIDSSVRYDESDAIQAEWGSVYSRVTVIDVQSTAGRYGIFEDSTAKRIDVAVRGTANLRNQSFDLAFMKKRSDKLGIMLHSGFVDFTEALYQDLMPRIREQLAQGYSLRISGHSLGAAVAIILGMIFETEGYTVEKVIAAAPPKVTDKDGWASFAKLKVIRLVCPDDPVPFLPPRELMYGNEPYEQGGSAIFLLSGRGFTVLDPSYFDHPAKAIAQESAEKRRFGKAEHLLPNYLTRLQPKRQGIDYVEPENWESYEIEAAQRNQPPSGQENQ